MTSDVNDDIGVSTASALTMMRLRTEATNLGRPEERHATLDRLEQACNEILNGVAAQVLKKAGRHNTELQFAYVRYFKHGIPKINPNRIEEYVLARAVLETVDRVEKPAWRGPKAQTIRGDKLGMLRYVRDREQEQAQVGPVKRSRSRPIDEDIDLIHDMSARQRVRFEFERLRKQERELSILKKGLQEVQGIDVYGLIAELPQPPAAERPCHDASGVAPSAQSVLSDTDKMHLDIVLQRLTDNAFLSQFDLVFDGARIKSLTSSEPLIEKTILTLLTKVVRR